MGGVSFLTPFDAFFAVAVSVPLAALFLTERRFGAIRRTLSVPAPPRRTIVSVVVALALLTSLVAVAAAQPVVVRQRLVSERADAQAFFLFDTSRSMEASGAPGEATRLARAKRLALRLRAALPDLPIGIASMTDRTLPNLLPTTDRALFARTLLQSVAIDRPPPSQLHRGRATSFEALIPLVESHFYSQAAARRLLVVFTDGESSKLPSYLGATLHRRVSPIFVHVWESGERIYGPGGKPDPHYVTDASSGDALVQLARLTGGRSYAEGQAGSIEQASRAIVGFGGTRTHVAAYARVALAPWFVLGGVLPLGFLLWRRNA